jgi:hypothetical protein
MTENGTVSARNGSAVATTIRLIALFKMTASRARNRNRLIRIGDGTRHRPCRLAPAPVVGEEDHVHAAWRIEAGRLLISWRETGGPTMKGSARRKTLAVNSSSMVWSSN